MFFAAILVAASLVSALTSPPSGAVTVSKTGVSGSYSTIQSAVNALSSSGDAVIFIYPGNYSEQVYITRSGKLTIYGYASNTGTSYSANQVTITAGVSAASAGSDDASGTLRVHKNNFNMINVNVKNTFNTGIAIAAAYYGTEFGTYGCQFSAYQDTLYTNTGTHYFKYSYIEGAIDFIFGKLSKAYFDHCTIASTKAGYVTANGRDSATDTGGYVFNSSTIQAAASAASGTVGNVYLGRPWRPYARVVYMYCSISDVINAAGWHEWSDNVLPVNVSYFEYMNTGAGSWNSGRVSWAKEINSSVASQYSLSTFLNGSSAWILTV
ncbi:hypothetical protein HDU83_004927 [Entophlyctis luteolus]|nr:hypothetical protein HDU82_002891 [Entophlyctis luteolus]KAJ3344711.1 hypothetical protein HDU83_004927 [Entophlyctis luteolus]